MFCCCRELAECKFAEYPIDTYGKATLGMAPLFSYQWSSSQDSSQSQGMLGTAPGADPKSPGYGATQFTQAAAGMVRATQGATVAQSASLALSMPRQDLASVMFSQGSSNSMSSSSSDTLSDRAVVRRRFGRSAVIHCGQFATPVIKMFMLKAVNLILKKIQGVLHNSANNLEQMLLAKCSPRRQYPSDAAQAGRSVGGGSCSRRGGSIVASIHQCLHYPPLAAHCACKHCPPTQ